MSFLDDPIEQGRQTEENKKDGENRKKAPEQWDEPDREAMRKLIREELKEEQDKKDKEDKKKVEGTEWFEVGKDTKYSASFSNGFVAETADQAFRFHMGGRIEWDNAWFTQDDNLLIGPDSTTRFADGTAFRRARLRADGKVWEFIDFAAEVSFATIQDAANVGDESVLIGAVGLTEFYLTFRDLPLVGNLRAGHFVGPYSLERYSSTNVYYYMERSSVFDAFWGPNEFQTGLMLFNSYLNDRVTYATTFTRVGKVTQNNFGFEAEDGLYAAGIRLTGLPLYAADGRVLLHFGVNYFHQALADNTFTVANRLPLRAGGGSRQVPNLLATGNFFSPNGTDIVDVESALVFGPFSLSAEYALARGTDLFKTFDGVRFSGPRGNATYHAFYVEGGLFLTNGDYRRYDKKTGTWGRTIPQENAFIIRGEDGRWCHGHGAVQLLARLSYLDLVSGSPTLTPASGGARAGTQRDMTLGVNWYLNPQTVVSLNYVWTHIDSVVSGASGDVHGVGARLHFDF